MSIAKDVIDRIMKTPVAEVPGKVKEELAELDKLQKFLTDLGTMIVEDIGDILHGGKAARRGRPPKAAKSPAKRKASPGRKLQGRYMGMLRRYKGRENARIKAIAKKGGIAAAIAEMEKLNGAVAKPRKAAKPKAQPKVKTEKPKVKVEKPKANNAKLADAVAKATTKSALRSVPSEPPSLSKSP